MDYAQPYGNGYNLAGDGNRSRKLCASIAIGLGLVRYFGEQETGWARILNRWSLPSIFLDALCPT